MTMRKKNILIDACSTNMFEKVVYLIEKMNFNPNGNSKIVQYLCEK